MSDFKQQFEKETIKKVQEKLDIKNPMAVPRIKKIVINESSKEFLADRKYIDGAAEDLAIITGQKARVARAKVSIATFKLREGDKIGLQVTLRGKRMYDFFEKLVKIVLPRVRDFSGVNDKSFDGRGNLTIGFSEHIVFPEIDPGRVDKIRSLQLTIITNAGTNEKAKVLLEEMGMPFRKANN
jgi:large subunit ribosomal protein L5